MKKAYQRPVFELYGVDLKTAVMRVSGGDYEKFDDGTPIGEDED